MALTKGDLQAIKKVVKDEIKPVKSDVSTLKKGQAQLQADFATLKKGQVNLEKGQANLQTDVATLKKGQVNLEKGQTNLKKGQKRIEKKFDNLFNRLDKDHTGMARRVIRIENHLGIPAPEFP